MTKGYEGTTLSNCQKKTRKKLDVMLSKSEEQLKITRPNFRATRLDLHYMYQKKDESLDEFITRCRTMTAEYDFSKQEKSERIIEQILESSCTPIVEFQKFLLDTDKGDSLDKVINEGRKHEAATHNMQLIKEGHCSGKTLGETQISFIKKKQKKYKSYSMQMLWERPCQV